MVILLLAVLLLFGCASGNRPSDPLQDSIEADISTDEMWKLLDVFSKLVRISGTEDERKAVEYVQSQLTAYGVPWKLYEPELYLTHPKESSFEVLTPVPQRYKSITTSISSTPESGVAGNLIFLEKGDTADISGKIALVEDRSHLSRFEAERRGALGIVAMSEDHLLHNEVGLPVWGGPTPETAYRITKIPTLQITRPDGEKLRGLLKTARVQVRLKTKAETGFFKVPLLEAYLPGVLEKDRFLLVTGHIDSWDAGLTDNATGDATLLELARVFGKNTGRLRRGIKFLWWPGHSAGRYAGSTWYADEFWPELERGAIAHFNIDSTGTRSATDLDVRSFPEVAAFNESIVTQVLERAAGKSKMVDKSGDESFWGIGFPSLYDYDDIPKDSPDYGIPMGGPGWWHHSTEDTIDKADRKILRRDAVLSAKIIYHLVHAPVLPFELSPVVALYRKRLQELEASGGSLVPLKNLLALVDTLEKRAEQLDQVSKMAANAERVNRIYMQVPRILNPILYTDVDRFEQEIHRPRNLLPGLSRLEDLQHLDPSSEEFKFLRTRVRRERNRVEFTLIRALRSFE